MDIGIRQRQLNDFTVIELDGTFTEHEEVAQLLAMVAEVVASGPPRILLDIKALRYVNSTGLGGLVRLSTIVQHQHGGELWLCHPSKRVDDLLALTKLRTVFHIADADTLSRLLTGTPFVAACPVCTPREWIAWLRGRAEHHCGRCGARFVLLVDAPADDEVLVDCTRVRVPTYDDEFVELVADDRGHMVTVHGRLDLFASEAVAEIWRIIPKPRLVIVSLTLPGVTAPGLQAVIGLCSSLSAEDRAAVVITGKAARGTERPRHPLIYEDLRAALAAMGPGPAGRVRVMVKKMRAKRS